MFLKLYNILYSREFVFKNTIKILQCETRELTQLNFRPSPRYYRSKFMGLLGINQPLLRIEHDQNCNISKLLDTKRFFSDCSNEESTNNNGLRNVSEECEKALNTQILAEWNASFAYLVMAVYFGRADVSLPGCAGYFKLMHMEELEHAHIFIDYLNLRGGHVKILPIATTECTEWNIKKALQVSLEMEKLIKQKLIKLHEIAESVNDIGLAETIVSDMIEHQEESINEISLLLARYNYMMCKCCGCTDFLFDKHIFDAFVKDKKEYNLKNKFTQNKARYK